MNSLGIVARAILIENQRLFGRNNLMEKSFGARAREKLASFTDSAKTAGKKVMKKVSKFAGSIKSAGADVMHRVANTRVGKAVTAGGKKAIGGLRFVGGKLKGVGGAAMRAVKAHPKLAKILGAVGAGFAGYKLYKHMQAKKAAENAAREAFYVTYMNLMEADESPEREEEESTAKKWGKRAFKAGAVAAGGVVAYKGAKKVFTPERIASMKKMAKSAGKKIKSMMPGGK